MYKLRQIALSIKYAYQRVVRGYDDKFVWGFAGELPELMVKVLKQFKKTHVGSPALRKEDLWSAKKKKQKINIHQYWDGILQKMIDGFSATEIMEKDYLFGEIKSAEQKKAYKRLKKEEKEGMELFIKHYGSIWD